MIMRKIQNDKITLERLKYAIDALISSGCPIDMPIIDIAPTYDIREVGMCGLLSRCLKTVKIDTEKGSVEIEPSITTINIPQVIEDIYY